MPFEACMPTRYERLFAQSDKGNRSMCSALARCARVSRVARTFSDAHTQTIWNVGCNVAGPLLFAYVLWVLSRARSQGIDRLYFLARDGEVLLEIARHICEWLGWSIDCRYLHASRQSLSVPALVEFDDDASDWVLDWWRAPTMCSELAGSAGSPLSHADFDRPLTQQDVKRLHVMLKDRGISERVLAVAREHREVLIDYLMQEGLADHTKWALCDVGWRGTAQLCLARITATRCNFPREFKGFYFGLNRKTLYVPIEAAEAFYPGDAGFVTKFGWLVEEFCWNEHGSVERFSRNAQGIAEPVLVQTQDTNQINWGCRIQRAAIGHFVENLTATLCLDTGSADQFIEVIRDRAMAAFELMRTRPSLDEAAAYGSMVMDYDLVRKQKLVAAPVLRPDRLFLGLALQHRSGVVRFWWPEGAIRRSVGLRGLRPLFHAVHHTRTLWDRLRGRIAS